MPRVQGPGESTRVGLRQPRGEPRLRVLVPRVRGLGTLDRSTDRARALVQAEPASERLAGQDLRRVRRLRRDRVAALSELAGELLRGLRARARAHDGSGLPPLLRRVDGSDRVRSEGAATVLLRALQDRGEDRCEGAGARQDHGEGRELSPSLLRFDDVVAGAHQVAHTRCTVPEEPANSFLVLLIESDIDLQCLSRDAHRSGVDNIEQLFSFHVEGYRPVDERLVRDVFGHGLEGPDPLSDPVESTDELEITRCAVLRQHRLFTLRLASNVPNCECCEVVVVDLARLKYDVVSLIHKNNQYVLSDSLEFISTGRLSVSRNLWSRLQSGGPLRVESLRDANNASSSLAIGLSRRISGRCRSYGLGVNVLAPHYGANREHEDAREKRDRNHGQDARGHGRASFRWGSGRTARSYRRARSRILGNRIERPARGWKRPSKAIGGARG